MADKDESRYCPECKRTKKANAGFYKSNNLEKYPDGYFDTCKECVTRMVDNWEPDTYLWILQEADVPYIPDEWNKIMKSYADKPEKLSGSSIVGRYLAKMKLKQWKDYRWKDSEFLQLLESKRKEDAMKRQGYDAQEIRLALDKGIYEVPEKPEQPQEVEDFNPTAIGEDGLSYFDKKNGFTQEDFKIDLTDEEKLMLRLKWGQTYTPAEWVQLEQLYTDFCSSYDIRTAGHIDTLKLICKTSLQANKLIDSGDIEGYQKMSRVYDSLMKSGKFTAAQNKAEQGEFVDSIAELVTICEREGFIPRYYVDTPNDKIDAVIKDMQEYTYQLVVNEQNLGNLIENAVKAMVKEENKPEDEDTEDDIEDLEALGDADSMDVEDFEELRNMEEAERALDLALYEEQDGVEKEDIAQWL